MKTKSPSLAVSAGDLEGEIFIDLSLIFAHRPLYRYSFDLEPKGATLLLEKFAARIYRAYRWHDAEGVQWTEAVLRFGETSFAYVYNRHSKYVMIYAASGSEAEAIEQQLREVLPPFRKAPAEPYFYMMRHDENEFSTEAIVNTTQVLEDEDLALCYGTDVVEWIKAFAEQSLAKYGGITILDGPPGTGKSTLIAQLMRRHRETHVFYVLPIAQSETLSSPKMVEFWQKQNRRHPQLVKVIVLEDAEKVLLQRRWDNNESVSALLNIADGLMGQMLKVHVLCTLNQGMEYLDPAILRPGRLRSYRYVGKLSRAEAQRLAAKRHLSFQPEEDRDEYSLAEVFHGQAYEQEPKSLGFKTDSS
jgi:hypothetical protein